MNSQKPISNPSAETPENAREATHLRHEIANTRADIGSTIEQLHGKLNPTVLKEQAIESLSEIKLHLKQELAEAKDALKSEMKSELSEARAAVREATVGKVEHVMSDAQETVKKTSRSFVDTVVENPIPAALAGIGLTWLLFSARNKSSGGQLSERVSAGANKALTNAKDYVGQNIDRARDGVQHTASSVAHRASDLAGQAQSKVSGLAHDATDKVSGLAHNASDKVTDLAHQATDRAAHVAHDAQDFAKHTVEDVSRRGKELGSKTQEQYDRNPLYFGAAMVAVGTAVGLAIPISRKEEEVMGAVRDHVMHKAEQLAHDKVIQVSDLAQKAIIDGKAKLEGQIKHAT